MRRRSIGYKTARLVWNKTNGHCFYCNAKLPPNLNVLDDTGKVVVSIRQWDVEHKTPLSRGGDYGLENLVPSCRSCNKDKLTKTTEEFIGSEYEQR